VQGSAVTPAAAYVEQGLAAADGLFGPGRHGLANLVIQQAMFLPEGMRRRVEVSVAPESGGESTFETYSRPADEENSSAAWAMHATGRLIHAANQNSDLANIDLAAARDRTVGVTSRDDFYRLMAHRGLAYGPAFQVLDDLRRGADEAVARVVLPESVVREAAKYHLHPALGDALLQSMAGAVPLEEDGSFSPFTYMPVGIRRVRIVAPIDDTTQALFTYAVRTSSESNPSPERVEGNIFLVDEMGQVLVALEGVEVQRLGRTAGADAGADISRWLYRVTWQEQPVATGGPPVVAEADRAPSKPGIWLIFADTQGVGRQLADRLADRGEASVLVEAGTKLALNLASTTNGHPGKPAMATIDPIDGDHYRQLLDTAFVSKKQPCLGVVHLWSLDILAPNRVAGVEPQRAPRDAQTGGSPGARPQPPATSADAWQLARRLGCGSVLQLVRLFEQE
jgi:hypothetical protein